MADPEHMRGRLNNPKENASISENQPVPEFVSNPRGKKATITESRVLRNYVKLMVGICWNTNRICLHLFQTIESPGIMQHTFAQKKYFRLFHFAPVCHGAAARLGHRG